MLIKKVLKMSIISVGLLILIGCSTTRKGELDEGDQSNGQFSDSVAVNGVGDESNFYGDETCRDPLKVGNQTYYFAFDNSTIQSTDIASLNIQARYLVCHPGAKILIAGNTDERGSREYNIGLGQRRALSVERFLRSKGVSKNQILTVSYGAEKPVAFGHSEEDYAKNRRANLQYQTPVVTNQA